MCLFCVIFVRTICFGTTTIRINSSPAIALSMVWIKVGKIAENHRDNCRLESEEVSEPTPSHIAPAVSRAINKSPLPSLRIISQMLAHRYTLLRNIMQLLMYGGIWGGNMIVMEYTQAGKMLHCLHTSIRSGSADRQQRHTLSGMLRKSRGWINTSQNLLHEHYLHFLWFFKIFQCILKWK